MQRVVDHARHEIVAGAVRFFRRFQPSGCIDLRQVQGMVGRCREQLQILKLGAAIPSRKG